MIHRISIPALIISCATGLPLVIAYQAPPQPAFYSQWLALTLWWIGGVAAWISTSRSETSGFRFLSRASLPLSMLISVCAAVAAMIVLHVALGKTPGFVALPALFALGTLLFWCVVATRLTASQRDQIFRAICVGMFIAGAYNLGVVALQTVLPNVADDVWIARGYGDRPYGNLRQPNLLALLLVLSAAAAFHLFQRSSKRYVRALPWIYTAIVAIAILLADSRAGMVAGVVVIGAALSLRWISKAADARAKQSRQTITLCFAAIFVALGIVAFLFVVFTTPLAPTTDNARALSIVQRILLWQNVIDLIRAMPWSGVGFGQLAFVWMLSPLPARAGDLFDHAHNAPLHLAVELGLPFAAALLVATVVALALAMRRSAAQWRGVAFLMLLAFAVQSAFEYPLWFAHFLLPFGVVFALFAASATLHPPDISNTAEKRKAAGVTLPTGSRISSHYGAAAVVCAAGLVVSGWTLYGYRTASAIYIASGDVRDTFARAEQASRHYLYGYYGDYARLMLLRDAAPLSLFDRVTRASMDDRVLTAWARALAREGEANKAAYLVSRAGEFPAFPEGEQLPLIPAAAAASSPALNFKAFRETKKRAP